MKKLDVYYCGWGEHWRLGTLADDGANLLFECSWYQFVSEIEIPLIKP